MGAFNTGIGPFTSITNGAASGPGQSFDIGQPQPNHTIEIVGSAGISAGAVKLEGSLDNVNWFQLIAPVTAVASGVAVGNIGSFVARYVRANISTAVTGGTVTVLIASAA